MEQQVVFAEEIARVTERFICLNCAVKQIVKEQEIEVKAYNIEQGDGNDMRDFTCWRCGKRVL